MFYMESIKYDRGLYIKRRDAIKNGHKARNLEAKAHLPEAGITIPEARFVPAGTLKKALTYCNKLSGLI